MYCYSKDMTDFVCERCRFVLDNMPAPEDLKTEVGCTFCDEQKGIMIFIDRSKRDPHPKKSLFIGWAHVACLFWNIYIEFVDETKFEVKQDYKLVMGKHRCKYCYKEQEVYRTSACAVRGNQKC